MRREYVSKHNARNHAWEVKAGAWRRMEAGEGGRGDVGRRPCGLCGNNIVVC